MKRNLNIVLLIFLLISAGCNTLQKGPSPDIVIMPLGGEVKVTEGSIVYALPLTVFEFDITARKDNRGAGTVCTVCRRDAGT